MAKVPGTMKKLIEQRDLLLREMDALKNKIVGLEMAIALVGGTGEPVETSRARSSTSVKAVLIDLLSEVGTSGLTATQAVEMANRRGVTLNINSVSSTLSRFKGDGAVVRDGDRYTLKAFVREQPSSTNVVEHPANGLRSA
jgi:hypothetical protein